MLRRLIQASAIAVLFAGPAAAQDTVSVPLNYKPPPTQEQTDKQKAADKAYDAAVKKIPEKKASSDPWGTIRSTATSAPQAKNKHQLPQQQQ